MRSIVDREVLLAGWFLALLLGAVSCGGANYIVRGEVIDASGAPLEDAWVTVAAHWVCCDGPADVGTLIRCGQTNGSGHFGLGISRSALFRDDEVEYFELTIAKVGYLELQTGLDPGSDLSALSFEVEPCAGSSATATCVTSLSDRDFEWCEAGDWQESDE